MPKPSKDYLTQPMYVPMIFGTYIYIKHIQRLLVCVRSRNGNDKRPPPPAARIAT